MRLGETVMQRGDVGEHEVRSVAAMIERPLRRAWRLREAVATMVMRIGVKAGRRQLRREIRIARRVVGEPVQNMHDPDSLSLRRLVAQRQRRAGWRIDGSACR